MTRSLAELRADKPKSRPERSKSLFLAPDLMAEFEALTRDLDAVVVDASAGPRRKGQGESPDAVAIRKRMADLLEQMADHEGEIRLRANLTDGEWRRWCNAHPAREEGVAGYERDQRVTFGFCNADDLLDELGAYVHEWNGEPMSPTDWTDILEPVVSTADKASLATAVITMYEQPLDFPSLRNGWQASLTKLNGSVPQQNSASRTDDSTAGSPSRSTAATTVKATA